MSDDVSNDYHSDFVSSMANLENTDTVVSKFDMFVEQACHRAFKFKKLNTSNGVKKAEWFDS